MNESITESSERPAVLGEIEQAIPRWNQELRALLPNLPTHIDVLMQELPPEDYTFYEENGWDYGVSGATPNPTSIRLDIDTKSNIPSAKLIEATRATYFHEASHIARGYSYESTGLSLIDVAIEEGIATKFEIDKAGSSPLHGQHQDREVMLATLEEVKDADRQEDKDWDRWKFRYPGETPEQDRYWILYRLGTFIAEEALANNPDLQIENLVTMSRTEILDLAGLTN